MSFPPQGNKADVSGVATAAALATVDTNVDTLIARLTAARAGYMDALNRDRPNMIFPSASLAIVVIPGTGADLAFPDVVVAGLPSGITIAKADLVLVIGGLFDTSSAENQIKVGTTDQIFVKKAADAWSDGSPKVIPALTFTALGLQVDADAYRGGPVLFGATDIKGVVTVDGTYNFRSDETNETKGVEATGGTLELLDVTAVIRVWFN